VRCQYALCLYISTIYKFDIPLLKGGDVLCLGAEEGSWFVDLKNGSGSAGPGSPSTPADATLIMETKDFFDLFAGNYVFLPPTIIYLKDLQVDSNRPTCFGVNCSIKNLPSGLVCFNTA